MLWNYLLRQIYTYDFHVSNLNIQKDIDKQIL